ncbi:hypothetical protein U1Q18_006780 [Sarracenia purpurea var. burkii]
MRERERYHSRPGCSTQHKTQLHRNGSAARRKGSCSTFALLSRGFVLLNQGVALLNQGFRAAQCSGWQFARSQACRLMPSFSSGYSRGSFGSLTELDEAASWEAQLRHARLQISDAAEGAVETREAGMREFGGNASVVAINLLKSSL